MHPDWQRICNEFMEATSYSPDEMDEGWKDRDYDRANRPDTYLTYPDAPRIELGEPVFGDGPPIWEVLRARRSRRNFLAEPMTLNELNLILWACSGITADMGDYQLRTAPSAGALYPLETYLTAQNVEGLAPGVYHLDVRGWALEQLREGDVADEATTALLDQSMCRHAGVNLFWTAVMERCRRKYYERAYRYVWWDAGHVCENAWLAATALGLGMTCMGAWYDDLAHELLGIDGVEHFSVLTATVGRVKGEDWQEDRRAPPKPD
jgi:SagB-type dehydrogenase family enzyme